ncbi:hypothetical protein L209DRAFT_66557 [Thermothelomyces heterothallicus CBS 203.75]
MFYLDVTISISFPLFLYFVHQLGLFLVPWSQCWCLGSSMYNIYIQSYTDYILDFGRRVVHIIASQWMAGLSDEVVIRKRAENNPQ